MADDDYWIVYDGRRMMVIVAVMGTMTIVIRMAVRIMMRMMAIRYH